MAQRHDRLALLDRYVRIPTLTREITPALVDAVLDFWRDVGLELVPLYAPDGSGAPVLWGEVPGPAGAPVVLLYGHYDVQPMGDPDAWRWQGVPCRPFEPSYFHDGKPVDPRDLDEDALDDVTLVGRGGADNKGQHLANVLGALDAARSGRARWTVRIVLDGEEESNSPSLNAIALAHRERFHADAVIGSDGPKQRNAPTLVMGVRGLIALDIVAENDQASAVHSGNYGNVVPNPALPLAALIGGLDSRLRAWADSHDAFRKEALATFAPWADAAVWQPFLRPGVNVNHLQTEGTSAALPRTIIPRSAHARLDVRITPDVPPAAVDSMLEEALAEQRERHPGVRLSVKRAVTPASYTPASRPEFDWLLGLLAKHGGSEPVAIPLLGGTVPVWVFTETLGLPAFWLPAANSDNNQHDLNEHFILRHFFTQTALYAAIVSSRPGP